MSQVSYDVWHGTAEINIDNHCGRKQPSIESPPWLSVLKLDDLAARGGSCLIPSTI